MPSSSGPPGIDLAADQRWCRWCSHAQNYWGFDRHQESCKYGQQALSQINYTDYLLDENDRLQAQKLKRSTSLESEDEGAGAVNDSRSPLLGPISNHYIKHNRSPQNVCNCNGKPWAPFCNHANFEFAKKAITQGFHAEMGCWATQTHLTLCNNKDLQNSLAAVCKFGVQFQDGKVMHEYQGKTHTFCTLCELIMWYPVEKYLHDGLRITHLFNELNTGSEWWEVQDGLPQETGLPHCFLPLHLWLDKSDVLKTVTKHPIILHPAFLPSHIRNGSGNGGGVLYAVGWKSNEDAGSENDSADSVKLAQFK
ncbi:hypothetical protein K439DRAFT_1616925 [Ramaria rubella]|nr:hypothetical protein K439DRAFT_1616925 [Ramaria rubella]